MVVILGILAAIVMPSFTNASEETNVSAVRRDLQVIRTQVQYYRSQRLTDPDLIGNQWDDLVQNDYLHFVPENPFNQSTVIAGAAAAGVGWVWRDSGTGVFNMYATDAGFTEFVE